MELANYKRKFIKHYGEEGQPIHSYFAPGRVCLIGEHIDYNGGTVLPAALSLGVHALYRANDSGKIRMVSGIENKTISISLNEPICFSPERGWGNYPAGVICVLQNQGIKISGGDLLFESNLPTGAGLSSSAAIEVLTGFLFSSLDKSVEISKEELAMLCMKVENDFVGVACGIMDQFAVAMGKKNHAVKINCATLEHEYVPIHLDEYELVIFNTNKKRALTDGFFNVRTGECRAALEAIQKHKDIKNLVEATLEDIENFIPDLVVKKRAIHVVNENQRVGRAVEALRQNDIIKFGSLLFETHASLKNNFEVSGIELDTIEEAARSHPACIGAKMSGAGFGGCAFAIIEKDATQEVVDHVLFEYHEKTGLAADYYLPQIVDGVKEL